jgi:acetyl-CoA/propionyl-CoA carboxylase biotin carboxyl carrier protein
VLAVEVAEGDEVQAGQVVCIVEAMKMENEVHAHRGAASSELSVAPGQPVKTGRSSASSALTSPLLRAGT